MSEQKGGIRMKIGEEQIRSFTKPKIISDITNQRDKYINKYDKRPNTIYVGYQQLDDILDVRNYNSVIGGDRIIGLLIKTMELDNFMAITQEVQ